MRILAAIATALATLFVAFVCAHSLAENMPTLASPAPIPLVLLVFLGIPRVVIAGMYACGFSLWCVQLFQGNTHIPIRTLVLFFLSVALSLLGFVGSWDFGLKYQGAAYTVSCAIFSVALFTTCGALLWYARKRPTYWVSLSGHTLLFVWLATYAFPYLGEMP
jgi:hypothetical protein